MTRKVVPKSYLTNEFLFNEWPSIQLTEHLPLGCSLCMGFILICFWKIGTCAGKPHGGFLGPSIFLRQHVMTSAKSFKTSCIGRFQHKQWQTTLTHIKNLSKVKGAQRDDEIIYVTSEHGLIYWLQKPTAKSSESANCLQYSMQELLRFAI